MKADLKVLLGVGIATLLIFAGGIFLFTKKQAPSTPKSVDTSLLTREDSYKIATDSAKLTLVEFGDFQCPSCAAAEPIIKDVLKTYAKDLNFVYRNYPLPQHQNAVPAAQAAEAAGVQGKYWQMHDLLYDKQTEWSDVKDPLPLFSGYAKQLGLNVAEFDKNVKDNKFSEKINRDLQDGNTIRVSATPTFYLNGEILENLSSLNDLKSRIDARLQNP
jgi:protein-disulfide isomerase